MNIKAIIFGATGMVGEGVLHVALQDPNVDSVLVVSRRACNVQHPKLKELIHSDFFNLGKIEEQLKGYNACYFCLGVSSVGMNEQDYTRVTYDLTMNVARTLSRLNPDMTFCYISGEGTDSTEQGRLMWARVKGKTENDLTKLAFKAAYNFRPGFIRPIRGLKNTLTYAKPLHILYPFLKLVLPAHGCTLESLGKAMVSVTLNGYSKRVLENNDIDKIGK